MNIGDTECRVCHGRGAIRREDGSFHRCVCRIREELSNWLGPRLRHVQMAEFEEVRTADIPRNFLFYGGYNTYLSVLKSLLVCSFFQNHGSFGFEIISGYGIVNCYLGKDGEDNSNVDRFLIPDVLVLELGNDPDNKLMPQLLSHIMKSRVVDKSKRTWVYVEPTKNEGSAISNSYGLEVKDMLSSPDFPKLSLARKRPVVIDLPKSEAPKPVDPEPAAIKVKDVRPVRKGKNLKPVKKLNPQSKAGQQTRRGGK